MLWLPLHYLRLESAAERIAHLHPRAVRNANSESNANSDGNCYCHSYAYFDAQAHTNGEVYPGADISSHSSTAPVILYL